MLFFFSKHLLLKALCGDLSTWQKRKETWSPTQPYSFVQSTSAKFAGCHGAFASSRDSFFLHESFTKFQVNWLKREDRTTGPNIQMFSSCTLEQDSKAATKSGSIWSSWWDHDSIQTGVSQSPKVKTLAALVFEALLKWSPGQQVLTDLFGQQSYAEPATSKCLGRMEDWVRPYFAI